MKKKVSVCAVAVLLVLALSMLSACSFGGGRQQLTMSESSLSLSVGSSANLSVTGNTTPLTWTSSDENIATVDDGVVKAKAAGSAVIKAADEKGGDCSCTVTVTDKEITKISLDHQTASIDEGKTIQLNATYQPADASSTNLTWSSSDDSVAVVNSEGYVTGVKDGVANITCKATSGVEASCTVTVKGSSDSDKDSKSSDSGKQASPANDGGYYGHFAPSYVYRASDFVFPESSVRQLSRSEISSVLNSMVGSSVSGSFAQDAINEIYARNGYCFRDAGIRAYYESKPWYYADESFTTSDFNSTEKYNINLLLDYT